MTEKELTIEEQREAIKQAAFVDELQKLGGALSWATKALYKATGKRLNAINELGTGAAKSTAKKRTLNQLEHAANTGQKRIAKAEAALNNPRQSMSSIAKNSKRLEESKILTSDAKKLHTALQHSYDKGNQRILQSAMNAAGN